MNTLKNTQASSVEQPNEPGFLTRLTNIFVNPVQALESIDRVPTWFWPMMLIVAISLITGLVAMPYSNQMAIDMIRNNPNIPPQQAEEIIQGMSQTGPAAYLKTIGGIIIGIPLMFILFSAIFYFVGSVILGGDSTFKKVFSIWTWTSVISSLGALVKLPLIIIKKSAMVTLSPALFLKGEQVGTPLFAVLSSFDFFSVWSIAIFAIGFSIIYKFSRAKAFTTVGVLWIIWIAIMAAFAGLMKSFGM